MSFSKGDTKVQRPWQVEQARVAATSVRTRRQLEWGPRDYLRRWTRQHEGVQGWTGKFTFLLYKLMLVEQQLVIDE